MSLARKSTVAVACTLFPTCAFASNYASIYTLFLGLPILVLTIAGQSLALSQDEISDGWSAFSKMAIGIAAVTTLLLFNDSLALLRTNLGFGLAFYGAILLNAFLFGLVQLRAKLDEENREAAKRNPPTL